MSFQFTDLGEDFSGYRLHQWYVRVFYSRRHCDQYPVSDVVGTTVSTAIALLVVPGSNRASAKDAFTLLENSSGWDNSTHGHLTRLISFYLFCCFFLRIDAWAFIMSFTAAMWCLSGCASVFISFLSYLRLFNLPQQTMRRHIYRKKSLPLSVRLL